MIFRILVSCLIFTLCGTMFLQSSLTSAKAQNCMIQYGREGKNLDICKEIEINNRFQPTGEAKDLYEKLKTSFDLERNEVIAIAGRIIELQPDFAEAYLIRGQEEYLLSTDDFGSVGDIGKAISDIQRANMLFKARGAFGTSQMIEDTILIEMQEFAE